MFFRRFNFCIWRTKPGHLFDFLLWWIIKLVWEPFSLKRSHWWHWKIATLPIGIKPLTLQGDDHDKPSDKVSSQTNFSWHKTAVVGVYSVEPIGLTLDNGKQAASFNFIIGPFQVGWNQADNPKFKEGEFEMCTIVQRGLVGLLVGPGATNFFAQTLDGKPLPLSLLGYGTKEEVLRQGFQVY